MRSFHRITSLIATASILILSGCSSDSASGEATNSSGAGGMTDLHVGAIAISNTAPIRLGVEQGFFEEEGLNLTISEPQAGSSIPGIVSGEFDFAYANIMSVFIAQDQGLGLEFVVNGASATTEVEPDTGAVIVPSGSEINSAADLENKTVSVSTMGNIGDTAIRMIVDDHGGDSGSIDFVEIDFSNAAQALDLGQVDAAWVTEPFITTAENMGAEVLFSTFKDVDPSLDIAGYFTSSEYVDENPEVVEGFQAAMKKSLEYSQENPDEVREVIASYTQIDEETLQELVLPDFRAEFDHEGIGALAEAAVEYNTLDEMPDLNILLP